MGSFGRSFQLAKMSWRVLQRDRELLWLPVIGALLALLVVGVAFGVSFLVDYDTATSSLEAGPATTIAWIVAGLTIAAISSLVQGSLVSGAAERMRGGDPHGHLRHRRRSVKTARPHRLDAHHDHRRDDPSGHPGGVRHDRPNLRRPLGHGVVRHHLPRRAGHRSREERSDRRDQALHATAEVHLGREPGRPLRPRAHRVVGRAAGHHPDRDRHQRRGASAWSSASGSARSGSGSSWSR